LIRFHKTDAYKSYNILVKKIEISRDVKVMEDETWNWKQNMQNLNCSINLVDKLSDTKYIDYYNNAITQSGLDDEPPIAFIGKIISRV